MALEVPTHVKKLYILRGDGELIESDVKDITIGSDTKSSLRATNAISDEVLHLINNKYFPEKAYNVKSEDLYKSRKTKRDGCEKRNAFIETKTKCASNLIRKVTVYLQNQSKTPSLYIKINGIQMDF